MTKCTARVIVTLDIGVNSVWGGDCNLAQVHKQAKDDANCILRRELAKTDVQIVGEMQVRAVLVDETK